MKRPTDHALPLVRSFTRSELNFLADHPGGADLANWIVGFAAEHGRTVAASLDIATQAHAETDPDRQVRPVFIGGFQVVGNEPMQLDWSDAKPALTLPDKDGTIRVIGQVGIDSHQHGIPSVHCWHGEGQIINPSAPVIATKCASCGIYFATQQGDGQCTSR